MPHKDAFGIVSVTRGANNDEKKEPVLHSAVLAALRKVSGTTRARVLREAFKDLLKSWGKQHDLIFVPEYKLDTLTRDKRYADGALLYELRVPFGYWGPRTARVISMKRSPKSSRAAMLKADKDAGAITLDSQTTL